MLRQVQHGLSCYLIATCNALGVKIDRNLELAYNYLTATGNFSSAVAIISDIAGIPLPVEFDAIPSGVEEYKIPEGRGLIIINANEGKVVHAIAYSNGEICDSMCPEKKFTSWHEYVTGQTIIKYPYIVRIIPLKGVILDKLIEVAERIYKAMLSGHNINPYEYRAVLGEAIAEAKYFQEKEKQIKEKP